VEIAQELRHVHVVIEKAERLGEFDEQHAATQTAVIPPRRTQRDGAEMREIVVEGTGTGADEFWQCTDEFGQPAFHEPRQLPPARQAVLHHEQLQVHEARPDDRDAPEQRNDAGPMVGGQDPQPVFHDADDGPAVLEESLHVFCNHSTS
jgi:hypothetical protein